MTVKAATKNGGGKSASPFMCNKNQILYLINFSSFHFLQKLLGNTFVRGTPFAATTMRIARTFGATRIFGGSMP